MTARRTTTATRLTSSVVVGVLLGVPVALLLGLLAPGAAQATTYRYWTYWWGRPGKSGWTFASQGPASDVPGDQWVLGWRFGETSVNGGGGQPPRASNAYAALCPTTASAPAGQRRVAVVVDYGTADVAPPGETPPGSGTVRVECVQIPDLAHGFTAMSTAGVVVRQGADGFVCGVDGYPRTECSAAVSTPAPASAPGASAPGATSRPGSAAPSPRASTAASTAARPSTVAATAAGSPAGAGGAVPVAATSRAAPGSAGTSPATPIDSSSADVPPADAEPEATLRAVSGAPASSPSGTGSPLGFLVGVLILGAAASTTWLVSKRRRGDGP